MLKKEIEAAIQAQTVEADAQMGMLREALSDLPVGAFRRFAQGPHACAKEGLRLRCGVGVGLGTR